MASKEHDSFVIQARLREGEASEAVFAWHSRWREAASQAEHSVAAREAAEASAQQALVIQRLEFERWTRQKAAKHELAIEEQRRRHEAQVSQLGEMFSSRVQALVLQIEEAQGLYRQAASVLASRGSLSHSVPGERAALSTPADVSRFNGSGEVPDGPPPPLGPSCSPTDAVGQRCAVAGGGGSPDRPSPSHCVPASCFKTPSSGSDGLGPPPVAAPFDSPQDLSLIHI